MTHRARPRIELTPARQVRMSVADPRRSLILEMLAEEGRSLLAMCGAGRCRRRNDTTQRAVRATKPDYVEGDCCGHTDPLTLFP